jgi:hypothetical protein
MGAGWADRYASQRRTLLHVRADFVRADFGVVAVLVGGGETPGQ